MRSDAIPHAPSSAMRVCKSVLRLLMHASGDWEGNSDCGKWLSREMGGILFDKLSRSRVSIMETRPCIYDIICSLWMCRLSIPDLLQQTAA